VGDADIVEMLDVINVSAGTADMSSGLITWLPVMVNLQHAAKQLWSNRQAAVTVRLTLMVLQSSYRHSQPPQVRNNLLSDCSISTLRCTWDNLRI
jgi:hypothetical protein